MNALALATRGMISSITTGNIPPTEDCHLEDRVEVIEEAIQDLYIGLDAYVLKRDFKQFVYSTEDDIVELEVLTESLEAQAQTLQGQVNNL